MVFLELYLYCRSSREDTSGRFRWYGDGRWFDHGCHIYLDDRVKAGEVAAWQQSPDQRAWIQRTKFHLVMV